mmetsp:Transcript_55222/g.103712  ORF Transcript_55222/g.103712 Transcript_55222/m.103712 type:complete len:608 (-) Transcript_55222:149-1972(-)
MPPPRPRGPTAGTAAKRPPFPWPFAHASSQSPVRGVPLPPGSWGFWGNTAHSPSPGPSPSPVKPPPPSTWGVWPPRTPRGQKHAADSQVLRHSPEAAFLFRQEELEQHGLQKYEQNRHFEYEQHQAQLEAWLQAERDEFEHLYTEKAPPQSPRCRRSSLEMSPATPRISAASSSKEHEKLDEETAKSPGRTPKPSPKSSRAGLKSRSPKVTELPPLPPLPSPSAKRKVAAIATEVRSPIQPKPSPMQASASKEETVADDALPEPSSQQKTKAFLAVCPAAPPFPGSSHDETVPVIAPAPLEKLPAESALEVVTSPSELPRAVRRRITGKTPPASDRSASPVLTAVCRPAKATPRRRLVGKQPPPSSFAQQSMTRGRKRKSESVETIAQPESITTKSGVASRRRLVGKQPPPAWIFAAPSRTLPLPGDTSAQGGPEATADAIPRWRITGKRSASDVFASYPYPGTPPPRWDKEQVAAKQGAVESAEKLRQNTGRRRQARPKEVGQFVAVVGDGWGGGGTSLHQAIVIEVEATTYIVALTKGDQVLRRTRVLKEFCEAVAPTALPNWPGAEAAGSPFRAAQKRMPEGEPPKKRGRSAPPKASKSRGVSI